jgi:hypothetical protein
MSENKDLALAIINSDQALKKAERFFEITKKIVDEIEQATKNNRYDRVNLMDLVINRKRKDVYELFGEGTKNRNSTETYFNDGLVFKFDNDDNLTSVLATHLNNGTYYRGKLLYGLGDSINDTEGLIEKTADYFYSTFGTNEIQIKTNVSFHKGFALEVEVWSDENTQKTFGGFPIGKPDTIKRIVFRRKENVEIPENEKNQNRKLAEHLHKYMQGENLDINQAQKEYLENIIKELSKAK